MGNEQCTMNSEQQTTDKETVTGGTGAVLKVVGKALEAETIKAMLR